MKCGNLGIRPCLEEFHVRSHAPGRALPTVKKMLLWVGIAFVVYTVIAAPRTAAQAVTEAFGGISTAGQSIGDFFDALVS